MKKNTITQHILRFTLLLIGGCTSISPTEEFLSPIPTHTILPTLTVTPTITPTLVEAIPINTATTEEQINFLREFMSHDGDCRLPCWWGISPGQTLEDAEKEIHKLRGVSGEVFPGYDPDTTVYGVGGIPLIVDVTGVTHSDTVYFEEKQGLVYAWHITSTVGYDYPEEFNRAWKNYSAQKIVMEYGTPNRVMLWVVPSPDFLRYGVYSLWLFYDELGFSIRYDGRIPKYFSGAPFFRICSGIDPLLEIELNMQSPDNNLPLERFDIILEDVRLGTNTGKSMLFILFKTQQAWTI